jgi:hypothetical protein
MTLTFPLIKNPLKGKWLEDVEMIKLNVRQQLLEIPETETMRGASKSERSTGITASK